MLPVVMSLGNKKTNYDYGTEKGCGGVCRQVPSVTKKTRQMKARWSRPLSTYLKESEANIVLKDDAAYTPYVTGL